MKRFLSFINPWAEVRRLTLAHGKYVELTGHRMQAYKEEVQECDRIIQNLHGTIKTLTDQYEPKIGGKLSTHTAEQQRIKILESQVHSLKLQLEPYLNQAKTDKRSGYLMNDRQQATDIKFRRVKTDLQVMKKICKQANVAIRYAAQHVQSNAIQSDLRRIAEIIHPDNFYDMGIENWSSADMVEDTREMQELIVKSNGRKADD